MKGFDPFDEEAESTNYFLSGCKMGDVKLWNWRGDCLRTYASSLPKKWCHCNIERQSLDQCLSSVTKMVPQGFGKPGLVYVLVVTAVTAKL
jgi:hypothetical protein